MNGDMPTFNVDEIFPRISDETLPVTLLLTVAEYRLIVAAVEHKIWALRQSGASGAYKNVPAYVRLREEMGDVPPDVERVHYLKLPE